MPELSPEEQVTVLRHHSMNLAGYAFALAQRQGLGPEEAARLWMEPIMQRAAHDPIEVETWLERNAAAMAMFHGEARLVRDDATWTMTIDVHNELGPLQAWEAVDYWVRWMAEQTRIVAERQGLQVTTQFDGATLALHFACR